MYESIAETLCLAVPIASIRPVEVKQILTDFKNYFVGKKENHFAKQLVNESLRALESYSNGKGHVHVQQQ